MRRSARRLLALALAGLAAGVSAQPGACERGAAEAYIDDGDVRAMVRTDGMLFGDGIRPGYEVPKGSDVTAVHAASLWIGGLVGEDLRMAAHLYGGGGTEYWPGPLGPAGAAPSAWDCVAYDRIWSVTLADVAAYNATGVATPDLADWPAHLGAPVVDGDGDPTTYDLAAGDRPAVTGTQTLWWIMNDLGGPHVWSGKPGLGVEVRVTASVTSEAYAASRVDAEVARVYADATHFLFDVTYRGEDPVSDLYVGLHADTDLGASYDDYIGTAPDARLAYVYNGDDEDEGARGYGVDPPALGFAVGPPPEGAETYLTAIYKNGPPELKQPNSLYEDAGVATYNLLQGRLRDGSPWTEGGYGVGGEEPTRATLSGLPPNYWSLHDLDGVGTAAIPDDRMLMVSQGPHALTTGETVTLELVVPWAPGGGGAIAAARDLALRVAPIAAGLPLSPDPNLATIRPGSLPTNEVSRFSPPSLSVRALPNPMPGGGSLLVRLDRPAGLVRLRVVDALGREVQRVERAPEGAEVTVALGRLAAGVYVAEVDADGRRATETFSVVR
ncbi:T9SS type A sorting domain-containing protein [Rubrivirga marina]|uniref:T9SS type A sorting domain-containing protein n=1 Tax=Rubrivirga marina TaxID=1196024 RepID=UPI00117B63CC|nr:T9SS type A sorting domain-containing protein [Rubrivirga marina]